MPSSRHRASTANWWSARSGRPETVMEPITSRAFYTQREAAAMAGIIGNRQSVTIKEVGFLFLHLPPYGIGTTMKASRYIAFAAHPLHIVGSSAGQRGIEERLPETAHVDHQAQLAGNCQRSNMSSEPPCRIFVKAGKLKLFFL